MSKIPLFQGMEFSDDPDILREWVPLIMQDRLTNEPIAATKIDTGTDVNFGALTRMMFSHLESGNVDMYYKHSVDAIRRTSDGLWELKVRNMNTGLVKRYLAKLHDYMGFSMVEGGFYSSGHPAPGSKMADPFGIVKITDNGKTLEILDLYKEIDFHGMTVGYNTKDIYVFNPAPNSRMDQPGFYYSTDETKTWNRSKLEGLVGQASTLAAHPTCCDWNGCWIVYIQDYGNSFEPLLENVNATAVSFDHHNSLLVSVLGKVLSISLDGTNQTDLNIPQLESGDGVAYVRQNPQDVSEYVFATFNKDIFITKDNGESGSGDCKIKERLDKILIEIRLEVVHIQACHLLDKSSCNLNY